MRIRKAGYTLNKPYYDRRREGALAREMRGFGYEFVSEYQVGQDPGTGAIHSYAVGTGGDEDTAMVCHVVDWTQAKNQGDRKRGVVLARGIYGIPSVSKAEVEARIMAEHDLKNYSWVQPGTDRPVVGSGRRSG